MFHSTHRFFITPNAIYAILYDMTRPETIDRIKYSSSPLFLPFSPSFLLFLFSSSRILRSIRRYWLEQVGSNDIEKSKPILIVGTHSDQLSKQEYLKRSDDVRRMYPIFSYPQHCIQIHGHYSLNITSGKLSYSL